MIPHNRIRDCWDLVIYGESEHFCSATPIAAALEEAGAERRTTGKPVLIVPMPKTHDVP